MPDKPEINHEPRATGLAVRSAQKSTPAQIDQSAEVRSRHAPRLALAPSSILCGSAFSASAGHTLEVAAALASRLGEPLVLVHALNDEAQKAIPPELQESISLYVRAQLRDEQERLRGQKVEMVKILRVGAPDAILLEEAAAHHARLLVLPAEKARFPSRWLHGDVTEQVAEAAPVPTLVVRDPAPLLRWMRGERRLRVFVGADFSAPSEAALLWVDWLRQDGALRDRRDVPEPPPDLDAPPALFPSILLDEIVLKAAHVQERYFRHRVRTLLGASRVRVRFEKGWGRSDAHLIQLATEERADLIVIGTHSRQGWHRLGHHSVSRGVLRYAALNVACVPGQAAGQLRSLPKITNQPCNHQAHEN